MDRNTLVQGLVTFNYVMKLKEGLARKLEREVTLGELEAYIVGVMDVLDKVDNSQDLQGLL